MNSTAVHARLPALAQATVDAEDDGTMWAGEPAPAGCPRFVEAVSPPPWG